MLSRHEGNPGSMSSLKEKYPGLPSPEGRVKDNRFQLINSFPAKILTNWSGKYLSFVGKKP
jgi:hypothetical protein